MNMIVGYEKERKEIENLKIMLLNAEYYRERGIRIPRGLALYGIPGVGKTQLAKSLMDEGITLIELRAASCCEENAYASLHAVFEAAKEEQPSVLLLDDLDKLAGTSEQFLSESNNNIQKMLLHELDTLTDDDNVLVVATCNDTDVLGKALLRPGRFDRKLHIEPPDENTRANIFKAYFDKLNFEEKLDFGYLARITPGYTGAQIECLTNEVGIFAMELGKEEITTSDVYTVMNKLVFNGYEKSPIKDKNKLRMIAVHEAGHALTAMLLTPDNIFGASILPQGENNGHIHFVNPDDDFATARDIENEVVVMLSGHVAERVILGEYLVGSGDDISGAESRIRFLAACQCVYGYDGIVEFNSMRCAGANVSDTKSSFNAIVSKRLNALDSEAENIIKKNRALFDEIVSELMEKQTLTRDELLAIKEKATAYAVA